MKNLMELYESVQSPLDDLCKLKKIIQIYSQSDKKGKDFYNNLVHVSDKKYSGRTIQDSEDKLKSLLFNVWKTNLVEMNEDMYEKFYSEKGKYTDSDFQRLRDYLSSVKNVSTEEEVESIIQEIKNNPQLADAFKKYKYTVNQGSVFDKWQYVDSRKLAQRPTTHIQHRLYLNLERPYVENMILLIISEADKQDMEFCMKFSDQGYRDDTIVIYANDKNILQYIEILRNIRERYPVFEDEIYPPPIMTVLIDDWIRNGAEPTSLLDGKQQSYTTFREQIIKKSIEKIYRDWIVKYPNLKDLSEYEISEKDDKFVQEVRMQIISKSKEYGLDENNFCFDNETVQQMRLTDSKTLPRTAEQVEEPDLEALLRELQEIERKYDKPHEKKKKDKSKAGIKRDKNYYKNAEAYLRGLMNLTPEQRKRGNQNLSILEQGQNLDKGMDEI